MTRPRVRRYLLAGGEKQSAAPEGREWVETDWDTALNLVAARLVTVKRASGPDAVGFVGSALCTNEENYLVQKLARQVIGTHNVENCARLCHAPTVAGLAMAFGSGAMSNSMDDVAGQARAVFVIGENVTECHPVFGTRLRQAVLRRGVPLVVADPRKTDLTEFAAVHLRHHPGTDVALLNGPMHVALEHGWHDRRFVEERCEGFEEFRAAVGRCTPEAVTGVPAADLRRAAELLARNRPMAAVWGVGITQHTTGVLNVLAGEPANAPGEHGRARRRGERAARPEQRAGRLRHGGAVQPVPGLPAGWCLAIRLSRTSDTAGELPRRAAGADN